MRRIGLFSGIVMGALTLAIPLAAVASPITGLNVFSNGTTADADDVNANFDAVETAVNDNDSRITAVESETSTAQTSADAAQSIFAILSIK